MKENASPELKTRHYWVGLWLLGGVYCVWIAWQQPAYLMPAVLGVLLSAFYQWILLKTLLNNLQSGFSASKGKWFLAGSVIRVMVFGSAIGVLGQSFSPNLPTTAATLAILGGFLSYKAGLIWDTFNATKQSRQGAKTPG